MTTRNPKPAYPAKDSTILYGDKELYAKLGKIAEEDGAKELVEEFEIPIRSGKAWVVKKGRFFFTSLVFCAIFSLLCFFVLALCTCLGAVLWF